MKKIVICFSAAVGLFSVFAGEVTNVCYVATTDRYREEMCRLDFRYPSDVTGFPTVVWFHGGGLTGGRRRYIPLQSPLIAQVAADYRLMNPTNGVQGVDCIRDAAAAVTWTLKNVAAAGGDSRRVYVAGKSAGGYLTMMVGMDPKYLGEHGFKLKDLAGLIPVSGQATKHFNVRKFSGDTDPQWVPKIDGLAPLAHVSSDIPPILSICGQPPYEWKCRAEENRLLIASCVALGHKSARYVEAPLCDHGRVSPASYPYVEMFVLGKLP